MIKTQTQALDPQESRDGARDFRQVIQEFAVEKALCDRLARAGNLKEAEESLDRTRRLHAELLESADARNIIHRRMVRNRRTDLSLLCGQVENCRLKKQAAALRRKSKHAESEPVEGA